MIPTIVQNAVVNTRLTVLDEVSLVTVPVELLFGEVMSRFDRYTPFLDFETHANPWRFFPPHLLQTFNFQFSKTQQQRFRIVQK